jgi:hypothetical protein
MTEAKVELLKGFLNAWNDEMKNPESQSLQNHVKFFVAEKEKAAGGKPTPAMQLLITDLKALLPANPRLEKLLRKAESNHYDDFLGAALPKLELIQDARSAVAPTIVKNTVDGKYDD